MVERGRPTKPILWENIELVMARLTTRLEKRTAMLDNGAMVNEFWLVDTITGKRTRTTQAKGRKAIEKIGQGEMKF